MSIHSKKLMFSSGLWTTVHIPRIFFQTFWELGAPSCFSHDTCLSSGCLFSQGSLVPYHLMLTFTDLEGPVLILYLLDVLLNSKNFSSPSSYFYRLCVCVCVCVCVCMCVLLFLSFIHYTKKHVFRAHCMSGTLLGTTVRVGSKLRSVSHSYEA